MNNKKKITKIAVKITGAIVDTLRDEILKKDKAKKKKKKRKNDKDENKQEKVKEDNEGSR